MVATTAAARSWGGHIHTHCAEAEIEVVMNLEERGLRHVAWLDSLGVLGPDVQLAHSVWLDETEIQLIAERGASVVHCPVSNMYLASGIAPIRALLDHGVNVALATDGAGSNNRQDMFETCSFVIEELSDDRTTEVCMLMVPEQKVHSAWVLIAQRPRFAEHSSGIAFIK